jgi:hypothetical protein
MPHHQHPGFEASSNEQKSVFRIRVLGIKELDGLLVKEDGLRFLKRDTVSFLIGTILLLVPFEGYSCRTYTVCTIYLHVKSESSISYLAKWDASARPM